MERKRSRTNRRLVPLHPVSGIQVDLNQNPEAELLDCEEDGSALDAKGALSCEERRKLKKKLNKKRRREKAAEMQRSSDPSQGRRGGRSAT